MCLAFEQLGIKKTPVKSEFMPLYFLGLKVKQSGLKLFRILLLKPSKILGQTGKI